MIKILNGLYLGNRESARDLNLLVERGITEVVNCAEEIPNYHAARLNYLALNLRDPDPTFFRHVERTCVFIDSARQNGRAVLVHCLAGISRSPSVILAYLCYLGSPLEEAARHLGRIVWTDPDTMFLMQIAEHFGHNLDNEVLSRITASLHGRIGSEE